MISFTKENLKFCLFYSLYRREGKGVGVDFNNWTRGNTVEDAFSLFQVMAIMLANNFVHVALAYYVGSVMPGEHGLAKPWHFPISGLLCTAKVDRDTQLDSSAAATNAEAPGEYFESELMHASKRVGIRMRNLGKVFKQMGTFKHAVSGLSLNIYEAQITVLLGKLKLVDYY